METKTESDCRMKALLTEAAKLYGEMKKNSKNDIASGGEKNAGKILLSYYEKLTLDIFEILIKMDSVFFDSIDGPPLNIYYTQQYMATSTALSNVVKNTMQIINVGREVDVFSQEDIVDTNSRMLTGICKIQTSIL